MKEKKVKAVAPYIHPNGINFKTKAYEAWVKVGGGIAPKRYPFRLFHHFCYKYELPTIIKKTSEARLRFVQPVSVKFDTFPDYARYEIIPFVWDCWPIYYDEMCKWLKKHQVKTAIFTSSQVAERIQNDFPNIKIHTITEGIDTDLYAKGDNLSERTIDILNFGRPNTKILSQEITKNRKYVYTIKNDKRVFSPYEFRKILENTKLTVCLPRCDNQPEIAGNIETLTQRYWECMLSRIVMIGRAPKELTDLIGYNPVINIESGNTKKQIDDILAHIDDYQELVDKNRDSALRLGDWTLRMKQVMEWLRKCGYEVW